MPKVVIHTPRDVNIDAGGAVWGSVGRSASLKLGNAGCGDWAVGNVEGAMTISQAGSGDTRAGRGRAGKFRSAGSGDISAADIQGAVQIDLAGSGDVARGLGGRASRGACGRFWRRQGGRRRATTMTWRSWAPAMWISAARPTV